MASTKKGKVKLSRKAKVRALFEREGAESAYTLGLRLGIKPASLRVWLSVWRHAEIEAQVKLPRQMKADAVA